MLDFWATWCGPCVQELPILTQVAESYKGKGVAFFAINLNETPEQVKKFQDERKLKFPCLRSIPTARSAPPTRPMRFRCWS